MYKLPDHIVPPGPDFRLKIDKTAEKVAKNPKLDLKLRSQENITKFPFIEESHHFYQYYQYKLQEAKAIASDPSLQESILKIEDNRIKQNREDTPNQNENVSPILGDVFLSTVDPHPNEFTIVSEAGLTTIPRLTLSFIIEYAALEAQYGTLFNVEFAKSTLSQLNKFDFVHPHSAYYNIYKQYLEKYTHLIHIINNPESMLERLDNYSNLNYTLNICKESAKAKEALLMIDNEDIMDHTSIDQHNDDNIYNWSSFEILNTFTTSDLGFDYVKPNLINQNKSIVLNEYVPSINKSIVKVEELVNVSLVNTNKVSLSSTKDVLKNQTKITNIQQHSLPQSVASTDEMIKNLNNKFNN